MRPLHALLTPTFLPAAPHGAWRVRDPARTAAQPIVGCDDETKEAALPIDEGSMRPLRVDEPSFGAYRFASTLDGSAPPSLK